MFVDRRYPGLAIQDLAPMIYLVDADVPLPDLPE